MDDLVKRADEVLKGVTPGPWAAGSAQWPEQVGCCPLVGRPFSVHGTDFHNVAAATTRANARFIAAARELVPAMRDRIEADAARIAELDAQLVTCRKYRDAYAECDRVGTQALRAAEARVKVLEAAMDKMLFWLDEFSQQVESSDPACFRSDYNVAVALIDKEAGE